MQQSIITILLVVQLAACVALIVYLINKLRSHTKQSPAEKALRMHLAELEATANTEQTPTKSKSKASSE